MGWVLLWVVVGANGALTSGSAEYDDMTACAGARAALESAVKTPREGVKGPAPGIASACTQKRTPAVGAASPAGR